jgi:hypothetical protein
MSLWEVPYRLVSPTKAKQLNSTTPGDAEARVRAMIEADYLDTGWTVQVGTARSMVERSALGDGNE